MEDINRLSKREKEVLRLLLQGKSNKQIARELGITEPTVESHLTNIYRTLDVASRAELLAKLGNPLIYTQLGESIVEDISKNPHNGDMTSLKGCGRLVRRYKFLLFVSVLLLGGLLVTIWLLGRMPSQPPTLELAYERECENFDAHTGGQVITRANASGLNVYGQFGATDASPWEAKAGDVQYNNINIVSGCTLSLKLRYSKNSPSSMPIRIYVDGEPTPRATFYPLDQGSWDRFAWTEPIDLGRVEGGLHTIKFSTDGQQYGVADLDEFVLSGGAP